MPGLNKLPHEFQLIFWAMFLFLGTLCSLIVYWTKRYIEAQDKRFERHEAKLKKVSEDLTEASKGMREASIGVKLDFLEFRKEISQTNEKIKTETHEIRKDLSTAQVRLVNITENLDSIHKIQKLYGKMIQAQMDTINETQTRTDIIEQDQSNLQTVVKYISEQVRLITSKKDDGSKK